MTKYILEIFLRGDKPESLTTIESDTPFGAINKDDYIITSGLPIPDNKDGQEPRVIVIDISHTFYRNNRGTQYHEIAVYVEVADGEYVKGPLS